MGVEPRPALADRTVLIVGYGAVGAAVEARLAGFECTVCAWPAGPATVSQHERAGRAAAAR